MITRHFQFMSIWKSILPSVALIAVVSGPSAAQQTGIRLGFPVGIVGVWDDTVYKGQGADPQNPVLIRIFDELTVRRG